MFTITAVFFSLFTLFLSYKVKQYLFIIITSTILGIYSVEIFLTMKKINNDKLVQTENKKKKFDTRSRVQVYKELKRKDEKVTLTVSLKDLYQASNKKIYALSGLSNTKTIRCRTKLSFSNQIVLV